MLKDFGVGRRSEEHRAHVVRLEDLVEVVLLLPHGDVAMEFQSQGEPVVVHEALDCFLYPAAVVFQGVFVHDVRREADFVSLGLAQDGFGPAID
eukprot:297031-Prorocentrum_minimum.AAC.1